LSKEEKEADIFLPININQDNKILQKVPQYPISEINQYIFLLIYGYDAAIICS
jgi:hypothetical protein